MASSAKAAKQRRKEIAKRSKEAAQRRKQMLKESKLSEKNKGKKASQKEQSASGFRVALAKSFPTFASALKVKPADLQGDNQNRPKKEFEGRTPTVNLLPSVYTEDREVANTRRSFLIAGAGVVGALSVVYFAQGAVTNIAKDTLLAAQTQTVETQQRTAAFSDVTAIYDELGNRTAILENIDDNAPEYFAALTELYDLLPSGSSITAVKMQHIGQLVDPQAENGGDRTSAACGDLVDPFTPDTRPVSACINFSGVTNSIDSVFLIMESYQSAQLLANVVVERSSDVNQSGEITFTGTAAVLAQADVTKIIGGANEDLAGGDPIFDDGNDTSNDVSIDDIPFEAGSYTINADFALVDNSTQTIIASSNEYQISGEEFGTSFVVFEDKFYLLDAAGQAAVDELFSGDVSIDNESNEDDLIEPVDPSDPFLNGLIITDTGDILDPFTGEVAAREGEYQYREASDQWIITATGQVLEMADAYYADFEEGQ